MNLERQKLALQNDTANLMRAARVQDITSLDPARVCPVFQTACEYVWVPNDPSVPRLADDTYRSWVATGVGILGSTITTLGYIFLAKRNGLSYDPIVGIALSGLTGFLLIFGLYEALTWRTFQRATPAELVRWIHRTAPPADRARFRWLVSGGGASSWSVQAAVLALTAVIVVTFIEVLRHNVVVVVLGLFVVVASWILVVVAFALHYARENAAAQGLEFPGSAEPVWWDYFYLSSQVSTTFSTSDVTVLNTSMRRHVTGQSVIAFLFNSVIVALMVSALLTYATPA